MVHNILAIMAHSLNSAAPNAIADALKSRRLFHWANSLALTIALTGCVGANAALTFGTSKAVPPDYRQRIASVLRQEADFKGLQSAEISAPLERFSGLAYGGYRPVVCVKMIKPNFIGSIGAEYWTFFFEDGAPAGNKQGATNAYNAVLVGCGGYQMSNFSELVG